MGQNSSADWGNVKLRKLLSANKSHVRETSLFTGAIPNPVRNSQTSRFVSAPGQNPGMSSRGDSVVLRLQLVMMADVWWCRSGTRILTTFQISDVCKSFSPVNLIYQLKVEKNQLTTCNFCSLHLIIRRWTDQQ